jgi:hypothetical protein
MQKASFRKKQLGMCFSQVCIECLPFNIEGKFINTSFWKKKHSILNMWCFSQENVKLAVKFCFQYIYRSIKKIWIRICTKTCDNIVLYSNNNVDIIIKIITIINKSTNDMMGGFIQDLALHLQKSEHFFAWFLSHSNSHDYIATLWTLQLNHDLRYPYMHYL